MTIKQHGGIFGRNPTFKDVEVDNTLTVADAIGVGDVSVPSAPIDIKKTLATSTTNEKFIELNTDFGSGVGDGFGASIAWNSKTTGGLYTEVAKIGTHNYDQDNATHLSFSLRTNAAYYDEKVRFNSDGNVKLNHGNLIIGTSGKGIDFSATSGTGTSELFDDYEEGTWTPTLTFATAGDVSVTYSNQTGTYVKVGKLVVLKCRVTASAFSHSTASGALQITGLPFSAANRTLTPIAFNGITKANYTTVSAQIDTSSSILTFSASGSGQSQSTVSASDVPTGGSPFLQFVIAYEN